VCIRGFTKVRPKGDKAIEKGKIMKKHIYQTAYELLSSGMKIVLAKIIRRSGSTPRDVGAMCIVTPTEVFGTVGGGLMEHKVIVR
jgi:xanthine/CO dehydrogenase XdhC/CoxF family maturation factor